MPYTNFHEHYKPKQFTIHKYLKELSLEELYKLFYYHFKSILNIEIRDEYLSDNDINEAVNSLRNKVSKYEDIISIIEERNFDYIKIDGKYVGDEDDDSEAKTNIITSDIQNYGMPDDMIIFYKMFKMDTKCNESIKDYKKHKFSFDSLQKIETEESFYYDFFESADCEYGDGRNPHYKKDIYYKEWFSFAVDPQSVDNGHGSLYTNLNVDSEEYGHIYSYSSADEGCFNYVCESLSDCIRILLSNEYLKGPVGFKICEFDIPSICDYLNGYERYRSYKTAYKCCKYCDAYLKLNKKIMKRTANTIGEWFLDCKMNPKYKYCRDRLEREHKELFNK